MLALTGVPLFLSDSSDPPLPVFSLLVTAGLDNGLLQPDIN
jgi:hypothetical protein